jgi:hypothetical protein
LIERKEPVFSFFLGDLDGVEAAEADLARAAGAAGVGGGLLN